MKQKLLYLVVLMFRHPVRVDGSYVYSVYPPKGPEILSFLTVCRQAKPGPDICLGRSKDLAKARKGEIRINPMKVHTSEIIFSRPKRTARARGRAH